MKKASILFILLFTFSLQSIYAQQSEKEIIITQGQNFEDSLSANSVHSYKLQLEKEQFVLGSANQVSVDVVVKIYNPKGDLLNTFDTPARGKEFFYFNTKSAGVFSIVVEPYEKEEGQYSIEVDRIEKVAESPEGRVDQLMAIYDNDDTPGAVIGVMKDGEMLFEKGYGMANLTHNIPFSPDVKSNIASISKQFTAFAIMLLVEDGKISLEDDIRKFIPELPDFGEKITLRNLLTHTSGYREYLNTVVLAGVKMNDHFDRDALIEMIQNQPELQSSPGSEYNYNNTGYSFLSMVVEEVTGEDFDDWMKENVFEPIGMKNTMVRENPSVIVPRSAMGYSFTRNGDYREARDLSAGMGAATIYTTVEDLAKWMQNFESHKVGSENIIKEMTTKYVLTTGDTIVYGLGLSLNEFNGLQTVQHSGSDMAHISRMMYFPEIKGGVIALSNTGSFMRSIANKVAEEFFGDFMEFEEDEEEETETLAKESGEFEFNVEDFEQYEGEYALTSAPNFILNFFHEDGTLYIQATGQPKVEITAFTDTTFKLSAVEASVTFHRGENGVTDSLTLHQNGNHKATRVKEKPWFPSESDIEQYTGKYFSEELETFYNISFADSNLVVDHWRINELNLVPSEKDKFNGGFPIRELTFVRDEAGNITSFTVSNFRTHGIRFDKITD